MRSFIVFICIVLLGTSFELEAQKTRKIENVDLADLIAIYDKNAVVADDKFKDVCMNVNGIVMDIRRLEETGNPILISISPEPYSAVVYCLIDPHFADVKRLGRGYKVKIRGTCSGISSRSSLPEPGVLLESCVIRDVQEGTLPDKSAVLAAADKQKALEDSVDLSKLNENAIFKSLVTVDSNDGKGSGFIANYNGRKVIITNIHVVFGARMLRFESITGASLMTGAMSFCADRDIAIIDLLDRDNKFVGLELEANYDNLKIGNGVVVYGNSMGADVHTRLPGKIEGIGPVNLEISSKIVPGNSGSPIISVDSGKVVAVAAFGLQASPDSFNKDTRFSEIRRFGLRIDSLGNQEAYDKKKYEEDLVRYKKIRDLNELAYSVTCDIYEKDRLGNTDYMLGSRYSYSAYPFMKSVVEEWNEGINGLRNLGGGKTRAVKTSGGLEGVIKRFQGHLTRIANEVKVRKSNYSWINSEIEKELKLHSEYVEFYKGLKRNVEASVKSR